MRGKVIRGAFGQPVAVQRHEPVLDPAHAACGGQKLVLQFGNLQNLESDLVTLRDNVERMLAVLRQIKRNRMNPGSERPSDEDVLITIKNKTRATHGLLNARPPAKRGGGGSLTRT